MGMLSFLMVSLSVMVSANSENFNTINNLSADMMDIVELEMELSLTKTATGRD